MARATIQSEISEIFSSLLLSTDEMQPRRF